MTALYLNEKTKGCRRCLTVFGLNSKTLQGFVFFERKVGVETCKDYKISSQCTGIV